MRLPGETFRGEIYAIEPSVDEQTRTVLLRARVPNPGARLKPGMFSRVVLVLETRENALIVPEQALVPQGKDRFVYRYADGKAALTKIELGLRRPGRGRDPQRPHRRRHDRHRRTAAAAATAPR